MAEQQRLREEKEAQERARAEQEENERLQRQVRGSCLLGQPSSPSYPAIQSQSSSPSYPAI